MAINLRSTNTVAINGLKVLVYGEAGSGKTTLIKTLPKPLILSAEGGLLSLRKENLPFIEIHTVEELRDAARWLESSEEAKQFESVALDSISEIAEVVLSTEKMLNKDGRAAYGNMNDTMTKVIRSFRDLPNRHVYFSAKMEKAQDETGAMLFSPSMPGKTLTQSLPFFFDEVFALRVGRDDKGEPMRMLMCRPDGLWTAKDRAGALEIWEPADLGAIITKIGGGANG